MKFLTGTMIGAMLFCGAAMIADDVVEGALKTPEAVQKWGNAKAMEFLPNGGPEGDPAVKLSTTNTNGVMCDLRLPVDQLKGRTLEVSADIKIENVTKPKAAYLGVKMMVVYKTSDGKTQYIEHKGKLDGTHDWREFKNIVKIPANAQSVSLTIGLQGSSGTVYFSDLDIEVED